MSKLITQDDLFTIMSGYEDRLRRLESSAANSVFVPGDLKESACPKPDTGWLLCDGSAVDRVMFSALFTKIGTTYGAGDGASTFNLPDYRGRSRIGAGQGTGLTNRVLGTTGGEETHLLTVGEMPSHSHIDSGHSHVIGVSGASLGNTAADGTNTRSGTITTDSASANIQNTGGGGSHNNMQPYAVINIFIKT